MRQLKHGRLLLVALVLVLSSCRESQPPPKEICLGDGYGGADCIEADGSKLYRTPSMLLNYWMTNETDEAAFASWCYEAPSEMTQLKMGVIKHQIRP